MMTEAMAHTSGLLACCFVEACHSHGDLPAHRKSNVPYVQLNDIDTLSLHLVGRRWPVRTTSLTLPLSSLLALGRCSRTRWEVPCSVAPRQ
jgi:hypothetical protein